MVGRFVVAGFFALLFWAWVAMPICGCSTREGAYAAAMKWDLKNLASRQEIYFSHHGTYSRDPADLAFTNSDGVIVDIRLHGQAGGSATATHVVHQMPGEDRFGENCVVYWGDVNETPSTTVRTLAAAEPGVPVCDYQRPYRVQQRLRDLLFGWM